MISSCAISYDFDSDELSNEIIKVEIINLFDYQGNLYPDDEKEYELLVTLNDELKDRFIEDFSMLEFKKYYGPPNMSPKGKCIKFYYDDESYAFITNYTYIRFNKDGSSYVSTQNLHTSEDAFMDLVSKYTT
jgi:hypothetical protein